MRPPKGGNIKRGVCQNHNYLNPDTGETGDCPKCASGEIQSVNVQRLSDFRCSVCGSKLVPVKKGAPTKLIATVVGAVALVIAAFFLISKLPSDKPKSDGGDGPGQVLTQEPIDSIAKAHQADSIAKAHADSIAKVHADSIAKAYADSIARARRTPPQNSNLVLDGAARLIDESGHKTLIFLRDYTLDLGKNNGETLRIRKGEKIQSAHISHNVLRGGDYVNLNNEENHIPNLNVKL